MPQIAKCGNQPGRPVMLKSLLGVKLVAESVLSLVCFLVAFGLLFFGPVGCVLAIIAVMFAFAFADDNHATKVRLAYEEGHFVGEDEQRVLPEHIQKEIAAKKVIADAEEDERVEKARAEYMKRVEEAWGEVKPREGVKDHYGDSVPYNIRVLLNNALDA
jgi:hypothetical protein